MGAKQSASGGSRLRAYQHDGTGHGSLTSPDVGLAVSGPSSSGVSRRTRTRSLGIVQNSAQHGRPLSIPNPNRDGNGVLPTDSDASTPDDDDIFRGGLLQASSLPLPMRLFSINGIKCPVCSKVISPEDIECHLIICLTKPRINYNEEVLMSDKDEECVICLEQLTKGETIARLPCLCIYHKTCIDTWFRVNRSCPEHPAD